ncbi:MAG: GNAT family N-acetyltransferase [Chloroflexota bacterium]|nr:GNAT family N-acetyltransferase [Chloroflexota bacterium]
MTSALMECLPWDSRHFGFRIARARSRRLDIDAYRDLEAACLDQGIECLYFLADAADQSTIENLLSGGFDFVDIRLTFAGRVSDFPPISQSGDVSYRIGKEGDLAALLPIAGDSFTQSRFFVDRRFGSAKAARMYQIWLEKSLTTEYADAVVVAEVAGRAVGFVTCHLREPGDANIGLVGVADSARGFGCAGGMLSYSAQWLSERGINDLHVVTQGRNLSAQRLYQRCGMVTRSVKLWFHRWFQSTG